MVVGGRRPAVASRVGAGDAVSPSSRALRDPPDLGTDGQVLAQRLRAAVRADGRRARGLALRDHVAAGRLDRGGHGRRAECRDGIQPPRGSRDRRDESTHGGSRAAARRAVPRRGLGVHGDARGAVRVRLLPAERAVRRALFAGAGDRLLSTRYTKRFTWASHVVLGLALAIAPVGGWLAIAGRFDAAPLWLAAAVLFWVAGFDTIYACQDAAFDRDHGLFSIPARFGVRRALALARIFHVLALAAMVGSRLGRLASRVYGLGLVAVAGVLVFEHRLVRADDLSKVGVAFLNANGLISVLYFGVVLAALALGKARP